MMMMMMVSSSPSSSGYIQHILWILVFIGSIVSEIYAREAIKPQPDVGQLIKDFESLAVANDDIIERGPPCSLNVQKDLPRPNQVQPLYLHPQSTDYWLPNAKGYLEIPRGSNIELHCLRSFANATMDDMDDNDTLMVPPGTRSILMRCLHDRTFQWLNVRGGSGGGGGSAGGKYQLHQFVCSRPLHFTAERLNEACGDVAAGASMYRVGYNVSTSRFVSTMKICHDPTQLRTHYTLHRLLPANVHYQRQVNRVSFTQAGHFDGYQMSTLYSQSNQQQQMTQYNASKGLFNAKAGLFLARGHLAAKADFIYASQQRSSFTYLNAEPQWQIINGGQWSVVEDQTRRFAARTGLSLLVYTGTWGIMPLNENATHGNGFYLATDANNNGVLAVPQLFYRILIDSVRPWRGIALVCVNNPHVTLPQILDAYVICEPVQDVVGWLRWLQNRNQSKGYLYACMVSELAQAVGHLPDELSEVHELLV